MTRISRRLHVKRSNALHSRSARRGAYLVRAAGALQPELRAALAAGAGRGARGGAGRDLHQPVPQHRGARGGGRCTPATRRCASSMRTRNRTRRPSRPSPRAGVGYAAPRRRAACCITATGWTPTAPSPMRRSCRRPRRTSQHRGGSAHFDRRRGSTCRDEALRQRCEQTVRNYDPCISCARIS